MRKKLSTLALILLATTGLARAYDFSAVTSSGHTLYYDTVAGGVEVTCPGNDNWTNYNKPIGDLVIDATVTYEDTTYSIISIGTLAFTQCHGLKSVIIGNQVTNIGSSAFSVCDSMTSVSIPNSVTNIGGSAFFFCRGLISVTIPASVTSMGLWPFCGCTGLTSVEYDATNCILRSDETFQNCSNVAIVSIGENVQNIPAGLFAECTGIRTVIYNAVNCTTIGENIFNGDANITTLTIGNNVQHLPSNYFSGYTGLTTVNYNATNCITAGSDPNHGAFSGCSNISTVTVGGNVQNIPPYLFYGCTGLLSIIIPDATTTIGNSAFRGCTSLTSASIGDGVTTIGNYAFTGCLRLTSVTLGEGVINIGDQAFKNCGIIGELVIPQSVTTIGYEGFCYCYGINEITCLGRVAPSLGSYVFEGLDTSITVNIPCGTTNLYAGRWSYFHNFNEIPFLFNVASADLAQGTVQMLQEPSCDDPVAIVQATARNGYHFDHWSDGSTQNPYTCVVTGSMTMTAFFAPDGGTEGIEEADGDVRSPRVYAAEGRIIVEGYEGETVQVYDLMGRKVSTGNPRQVYPNGIYLVRIGDSLTQRVVVL